MRDFGTGGLDGIYDAERRVYVIQHLSLLAGQTQANSRARRLKSRRIANEFVSRPRKRTSMRREERRWQVQ
jgi:hypothetical protein